MPTPSLLIVPARFKTGKMYSQIPTSGAGDFTVTRNTAARRFDSAGLVASVASGIPRLDYYTSGGVTGCPALLVEPAATNLAFHSEAWATASNWSFTEVTRATGSTAAFTAPDGTTTANAISPTAAAGTHFFGSNNDTNIAYVSGTIYTQSAFFKKGTGNAGRYIQLVATPAQFGGNGFANYDLELGTIPASGGTLVAASIQNYGNGWYRCVLSQTATASGSALGFRGCLIDSSGSTRIPSMTTSSGDVLYGWGAQVETGSVATSYIPTTAASGSRSADVISVSGAVSGSIGQTEGTFYFDFQASPSGVSSNWLNISDGTTNNWLFIGKDSTKCRAYIRANNSVVLSDTSFTLTGSSIKAALAYKSGDYAFYINGNLIASGTTAFTFSAGLTSIHSGSSTPQAVGEISRYRAAALYTTRLTNAELATLTTL